MKEKEKQEKLHELINILEKFYQENDLTNSMLMHFHMCSVASLMKQMDGYTTDFLVKDVNTMLDYLNSIEAK
jgi:hypothetical protein